MLIRKLYTLFLFFALSIGAFAQAPDKGQPFPEQNVIHSVQLFPNPIEQSEEYLSVKLETLEASKVKLTVHTIIGNEIPVETEPVDAHELRVKVKDLASGYYLLSVKEPQTRFRGTYKFLKK